MIDDAIVNEIHETRRRIFEECGGDLQKLIARQQALESQLRERLVTLEDLQSQTASTKAVD